jgi:membrane protein DedA with SNARE-associated domain
MLRIFLHDIPVDSISNLEGIASVFFIFLLTFVSEDFACLLAGVFAADSKMSLFSAIAAAGMGIFVGDLGLYYLGFLLFHGRLKFLGKSREKKLRALKYSLNKNYLVTLKKKLETNGGWYLLASRFLPGTRLPLYFLSPKIYPGFARFAGILFLGSFLWTPILVVSAYLLGLGFINYLESYSRFILIVFVLVASFYLMKTGKKLTRKPPEPPG